MTKGSTSYTWTRGRLLASVGGTTFEYDADGKRTKKGSTEYYYDGDKLIAEIRPTGALYFFYDESGVCGMRYNSTNYEFIRNIFGDVVAICNEAGGRVAFYTYDAWGNCTIDINQNDIANINPFRYRGYYYDSESGLYYLMSRYYDPQIGRFISPDTMQTLNPNVIGGVDLYSYANNNPIAVKYDSSASSYGGGMISSVSSSVSFQGSFDGINQIAPGWMQTLVGAIPDIFLGVKYLKAKGIHTKFAYSKNTRYMHPIMDRTWRWFGKSGSLLADFGTVAQASFKQILAGDARAKFGAIAKSIGGTIGLNFGVNAIFNLYENNWDYKNVDMWIDTGIDTAIGVSSYYLAAGTMSLITAGLVTAGVAMPGIVVVGGVVLLSMGFEWLIREIFNYHQ